MGLRADVADELVAAALGLAVDLGASAIRAAEAEGDEHREAVRRMALLNLLERNDGEPEQLVPLDVPLVSGERHDPVLAVLGQVPVRDPGEVADAEHDDLAHGAPRRTSIVNSHRP